MAYFNEFPNLLYQSPLDHKNSSGDYIIIKNIFRRTRIREHLRESVMMFNKFVIGEGDRPDTIANALYDDSRLDYIVVLCAGITNITNEWPLQDYQVYDYALQKYGSETEMNKIHHYETFEIRDEQARQILPPNLIVDKDFKIDGKKCIRHNKNSKEPVKNGHQMDQAICFQYYNPEIIKYIKSRI